MNHLQELKTVTAIPMQKKLSGTTLSGVIDARGAHKVLLRFVHYAGTNSQVFRARHCSASATLYASATAFTTAVLTSAATSGMVGYNIDMTGVKPFIRVLLSNLTGSAPVLAFADLFYNRTTPPATNQGFISITNQVL